MLEEGAGRMVLYLGATNSRVRRRNIEDVRQPQIPLSMKPKSVHTNL